MYQKVTITLPKTIVKDFYSQVPKGKRSEYIALSLQQNLIKDQITKRSSLKETLKSISEFTKKNPQKSLTPEETIALINKGRK